MGRARSLALWLLVTMVTGARGEGSRRNDIMLDLDKLTNLGDKEKVLSILRVIADSIHKCGVKEVPPLRKFCLSNRTVTCNDGSPAGYYYRKSYGSSRWIVFLEGGWFCFDKASCQSRWVNMQTYMSSRHWPQIRRGTGLLSWDPEENPYHYHANMVYIPYCSSDTWSGTYKELGDEGFSFMGSLIVEEVIKELIPRGLVKAEKLILAGSSAGGTGVLMNLDRIADLMALWAPGVEVRGVADSGWFLDNQQFRPVPCVNSHSCAPTDGIKKGIELWHGRVPDSCKFRYPPGEHWRCYFGYRMYPTLRTPVYVVQYIFDEAQITVDNVGPPVQKEQWQYIHRLGNEIKASLRNVSAVFAPACMSHILLLKSDWLKVVVGGVNLAKSMYCWENSATQRVRQCPTAFYSTTPQTSKKSETTRNKNSADSPLSDEPPQAKGHGKRRKRKKKKKKKRNKKRRRRRRNKRRKRRERRSSDPWPDDDEDDEEDDDSCKHLLIDACAWPQCNFACPKLRNPYTGEEENFVDFLRQLGLDLSTVAKALDMNVESLQAMDHDVLVQLLAQQT